MDCLRVFHPWRRDTCNPLHKSRRDDRGGYPYLIRRGSHGHLFRKQDQSFLQPKLRAPLRLPNWHAQHLFNSSNISRNGNHGRLQIHSRIHHGTRATLSLSYILLFPFIRIFIQPIVTFDIRSCHFRIVFRVTGEILNHIRLLFDFLDEPKLFVRQCRNHLR